MESSFDTLDQGTTARWAVGALLAWSAAIGLFAYLDTQGQIRQSMLFHAGIWLIGLIGGGIFFQAQHRHLRRLDRAHIALRDSEARHNEAQRTAQLGHWSYDTGGERFLWWSEETFRLLGLDPAAGHPDYGTFIARLHPADRDRVKAVVAQCRTDGQPFVVEYRVPLAAGGESHLEARGMAHLDARGQVERMSGTVMDITQRRLAEQQLLRFRALAEASADAFIMANSETTLLGYANKAAHDLFGCDYARQEMIGLPGASFWPADDQETMRRVIGAGLQPGGWRGNVRQQRKDGVIFDASATVFSIGAEPGDPRCLVAIIRDISEQKLAEQALRTANEKFEAIIDFLPDATFVVDADSRVIAWNRAMERFTGVAKADIMGKGDFAYAEALYGQGRPMLVDLVLADADRGPTFYKTFRQEGQTLYAEGDTPEAYGGRGAYVWATALPLTDSAGRRVGAIECVRDITESRAAEQALQSGEERLRLALEGTSDGIWDWDLASGRAYFSPRYYTMLGYRPDEFPATVESWRALVHPDDLAAAEAAVRAHIDGVGDNYAAEFRCRCKDGSWRWILGRGKVVRWDETGRPARLAGSHSDIADRKEVERRLRLTQFTVDNASDAVFWFDRDGRFSYANNPAGKLLGYACDELTRMSIPDVDINLSSPDIRPLTEKLVAEGTLTLETGLRRKDGRVVPVEISAKHIAFAGDEHLVAHVRDVSERKRAESALRAEKQFSDAVIASLPGVFYLFDQDTRLLRWNQNLMAVTGRSPERMAGMLASDFIAEPDRAMITERMLEVLHQGATTFAEAGLLTASGDSLPYYFTALRMREGDRDYLIGMGIDLSAQRHAQEALRLTRFAVERSADAMYLIDSDGRFLDVNVTACRELGYDRPALLSMTVSDVDPDLSAEIVAGMFTDLRHQGSARIETRHRRADGSIFPVEVMANYIEFDGIEYNCCFVRDISERKEAERALRELNATLEERVREEVALNREKDHLMIQQARLAAMGEMIGNIAHQWRQPINALSLVLANIEDAFDFGELDRHYLKGQMAKGGQLIHKMSTTIDDFRNFFRPDRTRQPFSLATAVRDAIMIVDSSYAHAGIDLVLEVDADAVCSGFPNEYSQVVLNLLANAKDAIIEHRVAHGRVVIRIEQADRQALLTVTDNGGGIPPDVLHKVFDPYFTTRDKGTGIGLYMSRMIIENMAGHIDVANIDHGTRVVVALPMHNPDTDAPPA